VEQSRVYFADHVYVVGGSRLLFLFVIVQLGRLGDENNLYSTSEERDTPFGVQRVRMELFFQHIL